MKSFKKITALVLVLALGVVAPLSASATTNDPYMQHVGEIMEAIVSNPDGAPPMPEQFVIGTQMLFLGNRAFIERNERMTPENVATAIELIEDSWQAVLLFDAESMDDLRLPRNLPHLARIMHNVERVAYLFCLDARLDIVTWGLDSRPNLAMCPPVLCCPECEDCDDCDECDCEEPPPIATEPPSSSTPTAPPSNGGGETPPVVDPPCEEDPPVGPSNGGQAPPAVDPPCEEDPPVGPSNGGEAPPVGPSNGGEAPPVGPSTGGQAPPVAPSSSTPAAPGAPAPSTPAAPGAPAPSTPAAPAPGAPAPGAKPPIRDTGVNASTGIVAMLALTGLAGGAGLLAKKKD